MVKVSWMCVLHGPGGVVHIVRTLQTHRGNGFDALRQSVRAELKEYHDWFDGMIKFFYAIGDESQEYLASEVQEVFFAE